MSDPLPDRQLYPIGRFEWTKHVTADDRTALLERLATAPGHLRALVTGLTDRQLDTPYREGGWTARQVVHRLPDNRMNSYVRFKPYDEAAWALLGDTAETPVSTSLILLETLHERRVILLRGLTEQQWARSMRHPEHGLPRPDRVLTLYAWHGDHHIGHIRNAIG